MARTCFTCKPADAGSLAEKIIWAKSNYSVVQEIAENGYNNYKKN